MEFQKRTRWDTSVAGKAWQDFLDSLSTRGGNILILLLATTGLLITYFRMAKTGEGTSSETIKTLLVGFAGALLAILSAQASRQQMEDRVDTTTHGAKVIEKVVAPDVVVQTDKKP